MDTDTKVSFKRAVVIGSSGAGKSTFARRLNEITGIPLHYLDMIWHKPDKTNVSEDEFDRVLSEIIATDEWIIDGTYSRTLRPRLLRCDTVFMLDYPLDVCLSGAMSRIGKKRPDMPWTEDVLDEEFRQWIVDFQTTKLPTLYSMLDEFADKEIVIFHSREESERYLENLVKSM